MAMAMAMAMALALAMAMALAMALLRSTTTILSYWREKKMADCVVCGRWFTSAYRKPELCPVCELALVRLNGYAAPVVRCKDCKHCISSKGDVSCGRKFTEILDLRKDDFCSYGERRADNEK